MYADAQSGWATPPLSEERSILLADAAELGWPTTVIRFGHTVGGQQAWDAFARHAPRTDVKFAHEALARAAAAGAPRTPRAPITLSESSGWVKPPTGKRKGR